MTLEWLKTELSQDNFKGVYSYNAQYIAMLLRLADLLDIDELRTPLHLYQLINPKSFSDLEWKQHFVIANTPKVYTNSVTNQKEIIFYGESTDPKVHRKLLKYIDFINQELLDAVNSSLSFQDKKYLIFFNPTIINKIKTKTFTFSDFRLDLDYNAVTKLLMGEHIYGDKKYGLRELIQNSIDACMLMKEISLTLADYKYEKYKPYINIIFNKDKKEVRIVDNGVGMSLEILKKYFLNVGVSYYSSNDYKYKGYAYNPIGNYGIGFLACFMLSDNVRVESKRYDEQKLYKIDLERNSEYICLTQEASNRMQGTDISLDLEQFCEVFKDETRIKQFLDLNFIDNDIPIKILLFENGDTTEISCSLNMLQKGSLAVARLDKYLNNIQGFIELSCIDVGAIETLKDFEGDSSFVYLGESKDLVKEDELVPLNINKYVKDGEVSYLKIPIISNYLAADFIKYLDVLEDFDDAIEKLNDVEYIEIFCEDTDEFYEEQIDDSNDPIVGQYSLNEFCTDFGHSITVPTKSEKIKRLVINEEYNKVLPYQIQINFGQYSWDRSDKNFIKNVFIPNFGITIPYIIDGINLKSAIFNIKHKEIIPNVSRSNVQKEDAEEFSYAIGKALHIWVLDNIQLDAEDRQLLKKFINMCYGENNRFLNVSMGNIE